ncbi:hypothetical protein ACF0H5_014057 [Mactra antiquata]
MSKYRGLYKTVGSVDFKMDTTITLFICYVVISSFHQFTVSTSCFCTNKDKVPLYKDEYLTNLATTVPKIKTCFIGTLLKNEDISINVAINIDIVTEESYIRIEEFAFGKYGCQPEQQSWIIEDLFTDKFRNNTLSLPYFASNGDFIKQLHVFKDVGKRFVVPAIVIGIWNSWGGWSACSVTCENGVITRTRTCERTSTLTYCDGSATENKLCTTSQHCPIDGNYTLWSVWSSCPVTCGAGTIFRTRYCTNPSPQFGGKNCSGLGNDVDVSICNTLCPVNGGWGEWHVWSSTCSVTCGIGVTKRFRQCSNPAPANGGEYCKGDWIDEKHCNGSSCLVNGGWGEWHEWSSTCSVTCGIGVTKRFRQCSNPAPANGGEYCKGDWIDEKHCNGSSCPLNGGWGEWHEWSSTCSVTCGIGVTKRFRQCSNPAPANGGEYCKGDWIDEKHCNGSSCPLNGGWGEWHEWSSTCSVTCGIGVTKRFRQCSNPAPANGGEYCKGDWIDEKDCNESSCPCMYL